MAENQTEIYQKISQELRRGLVVLAALSRLEDAQYGYSLIGELGDAGFQIDQGTLYPLLRRLEDQGLLESSWNTEGSRPRRYYRLNDTGRKVLAALAEDWRGMVEVMENLLKEVK
jgi:DNA-binding PadR family transcriptional regulator